MIILNSNVFERLASQRLVTISEVVNSLFGLNPNTKTKDLKEEMVEEVQDIKKTISRNIRSLNIQVSSVNDEMNSDLVFAATHDFMREGITPEIIIEKGKEAVIAYSYSNDWQKYMMAFGGRPLVELVSQTRKSGRGQHRKSDEEQGTQKMMGLLIKLLAYKHPNGKYGTVQKPTISEIYKDILALAEKEQVSEKGIKRSAFHAKASLALKAIHDES
ncbi:hypothetical protein [Acerihabitans sp.]|uniref:hypothetical protein n=1 Tax=Acerihabitans sp. TaxID=2811394 RepID=UPI002ED93EAF